MSDESEGRQGGVAGCEGGWGESWLRKMEATWVAGPAAILEPPIVPTICWLLKGQNGLDARALPSPSNHLSRSCCCGLGMKVSLDISSILDSVHFLWGSVSLELFQGLSVPYLKVHSKSTRLPTFHSTWGGEVVSPNYPKDCKALDSSLWKKAWLATSPTSRGKTRRAKRDSSFSVQWHIRLFEYREDSVDEKSPPRPRVVH